MTTAEHLDLTTPSPTEMVIKRFFAGPKALVFDCWTKPELVKQWLWGPDGWHIDKVEIDLTPGGKMRYEMHHDDGRTMGWGGTVLEVDAPDRWVHTELFDEDWTGGETHVTNVFTEEAGGTLYTQTTRFKSQAGRDEALASGMEKGILPSFARIDAILAARR